MLCDWPPPAKDRREGTPGAARLQSTPSLKYCIHRRAQNEQQNLSPGTAADGQPSGLAAGLGAALANAGPGRSAPAANQRFHRQRDQGQRGAIHGHLPHAGQRRGDPAAAKAVAPGSDRRAGRGRRPGRRGRGHRRPAGRRQGHAGGTLQPFRRPVDRRPGADRDRAHGQGPQAGLHGDRRRDDAPPGEDRRGHHEPRARAQPDRRRRGPQVRHARHDPGGRASRSSCTAGASTP